MNDPTNKQAAAKNRVAQRFMDVSKELAQGPRKLPGLQGDPSFIPSWFAQAATGLSGAIAEKAPDVARGVGSVASDVIDIPLAPGGPGPFGITRRAGDFLSRHATLPKVIIGGQILSIPFAADAAYFRSDTVAPLAEAQARGENLMTDPFTSFVQKRANEKVAVQAIPRAFGHGIDILGDVLGELVTKPGKAVPKTFVEKGVMKQVTDAITGKPVMEAGARVFSPGRAATAIGGAAVLGAGADLLQGKDSVGSGVEYMLAKQYIPIEDRIQATDTAATAFLTQSGKNMANLMDDALREGVNVGASASVHHNRSFNQDLQFQAAMQADPLLREATPQDKDMLRRSFNSMTRFSPDLATDEFAVKNFLRESLLAANGPDYATLGNMARVNEAIAPSALLPQKTKAAV